MDIGIAIFLGMIVGASIIGGIIYAGLQIMADAKKKQDEEIREIAKKRVEFKDHLVLFVAINTVLVILNLWLSPMFYWFPLVIVFWGIGLIYHWREAYAKESRMEREYQKLKKQQKK